MSLRPYDRLTRAWARLFGRLAARRLNNLLVNLGTAGLGVGNADASTNGERRVLAEWLRECGAAPVVWDVGANRGDYVALVRATCPAARIHAFEPQPAVYAALAERWSAAGVQCRPFALGARAGTLPLWDYAAGAGSEHATFHPGAITRETGAALRACDVPVRTIDEVAAAESVTHISLLKLDVEGHELACLEGAAGLLAAGRIAAVQFEFNSLHLDAGVRLTDFAARLADFDLYRVLPHGLLPLDFRDTMLSNLYRVQNVFARRRPGPV